MKPIPFHATCIALRVGTGPWGGVLFRGPPGSGKSDLALRILEARAPATARLVADDYVELTGSRDGVMARPPDPLAGLLEVRGLGIVKQDYGGPVRLVLAFDLCPPEQVARLPRPQVLDLGANAGKEKIPLYRVCPFEASAAAKVALTFACVTGSVSWTGG